jgi:hypothetical protein
VPIHVYRQDIDMSYYGPAGKDGTGGWDTADWQKFRDQIRAVRISDAVTPESGDTIDLDELLQNDRKRLYDTKVLVNGLDNKVDEVLVELGKLVPPPVPPA